ncbi:carbamoyltransferase HypF [Salinactinospora qingdaonensis]|uniref:Carbamoyltransferase n=1 Tax=Salinactinospora qingdaonensis TaxID=702744 RepID=A0ABP7FAK5_9ACTN
MTDGDTQTRRRIRVEGIVQGVGFRPFVYTLATRHGLTGHVGNDTTGVYIEIQGSPERVASFGDDLLSHAPPLAAIERVSNETITCRDDSGFHIDGSDSEGQRAVLVSPDVGTCAPCLSELFDPNDRRYRYPFTNCTNCGPRFTIVTDVPYDRAATTMADFAMCGDCAREYHTPTDRRFHAQPVCCPACGPTLRLVDADGRAIAASPADPIATAAALLSEGHVVAVKGLGGYHLATDATNQEAVATLRRRKRRGEKPFAVMAAHLDQARHLCHVDPAEARTLACPRHPIVLLRRRTQAVLAEALAPGERNLGVMLPYTPLHHLLAREHPAPLTMTSGNLAEEPIVCTEDAALERLGGVADYFLVHDRPIHARADDSVVRVVADREYPIRRARGYAPAPLPLPHPAPRPLLACGAELKSTFCLATARRAIVSSHIGDLENYETLRCFTEEIARLSRLFGIKPQVVAHDLHPEYLSTKYATDLATPDGPEPLGVQHHHAHIASCLADNGHSGPVIGVAFDGLGYGTDATMWGGEFLVADLTSFERRAHLVPVAMPGGAAAVKEPWRMAAAYLDAAFEAAPPPGLAVAERNAHHWEHVRAVARAGVNAPLTSSAGRLFDAVAAVVGVRDRVGYEGHAALELQQRADPHERGHYPVRITGAAPLRVHGTDLVRGAVDDLCAGADPATIAARFHNGLTDAAARVCLHLAEETGLGQVALSGGVFQNTLLLGALRARLERRGLRVLVHERVPTNDGGISFGQAAVAAATEGARA